MSARFRNRWKKESIQLKQNGIQYVPEMPTRDLFVVFQGPEGSPYEGGFFRLRVVLGQFPVDPPSVTMVTRCYNPYIAKNGNICCSLLSLKTWSELTTLKMIVEGVIQLLTLAEDSRGDDPLEPEIYKELQENPKQFCLTAERWTQQYAKLEVTSDVSRRGREETAEVPSPSLKRSKPGEHDSEQDKDSKK